MKILSSFTLCLLVLISLPFVSQAQDVDANSKGISLSIDGTSWQPQATRAEYSLEKGQDLEVVSIGMFRLEGTKVLKLSLKMVRFEGEGEYKVGEKYNLIGSYQETVGAEAGPVFKMVNESGVVEITSFDTKNLTISGKFSFDLKSEKSDEVMHITDGKFKNVQLLDVTPVADEN